MTKHITSLAFAALFLLTGLLSAQVSITQEDLPALDSVYALTNANLLTDYDFEETGADFTWDFSDLESFNEAEQAYIPVGDAPFTYQVFFNNPFDEDYLADFALNTEGFSAGPVEFSNFYQFIQKDESAYEIVGQGATVNDLPVPAQTDPIDVVYDLPLDFGNAHSSYSEWQIEIPTLGYYRLQQNRTYEVDGWGEVTTPTGSYNALRVRMNLEMTDSVYVDFIQQGLTFDREMVQYLWLAEEEGIPVLSVSVNFDQVSSITYKIDELDEDPVGIAVKTADAMRVYPTVTSGMVNVSGLSSDARLRLLDGNGKLAQELPNQSTFNLSDHPVGMYFVEIQTPGAIAHHRIFITR